MPEREATLNPEALLQELRNEVAELKDCIQHDKPEGNTPHRIIELFEMTRSASTGPSTWNLPSRPKTGPSSTVGLPS